MAYNQFHFLSNFFSRRLRRIPFFIIVVWRLCIHAAHTHTHTVYTSIRYTHMRSHLTHSSMNTIQSLSNFRHHSKWFRSLTIDENDNSVLYSSEIFFFPSSLFFYVIIIIQREVHAADAINTGFFFRKFIRIWCEKKNEEVNERWKNKLYLCTHMHERRANKVYIYLIACGIRW